MRKLSLVVIGLLVAVAGTTQTQHDYGKDWNSWLPDWRIAYLRGFGDGQSQIVLALPPCHYPDPERLALIHENWIRFCSEKPLIQCGNDKLAAITTDLYRDPANTLISFSDAVLIAKKKLLGEDVEELIRKARRAATGGR